MASILTANAIGAYALRMLERSFFVPRSRMPGILIEIKREQLARRRLG